MRGTQDKNLAPESNAQAGVLGHIANINQNMQETIREIAEYKNKCQASFQQYINAQRQASAQAAQARAKQDEERGEYCSRLQSLGRVPGCESAEEFDEIVSIGARLGDATAVQNLRSYSRMCRNSGADGNTDIVQRFRTTRNTTVARYCSSEWKNSIKPDSDVELSSSCQAYLACRYQTDDEGNLKADPTDPTKLLARESDDPDKCEASDLDAEELNVATTVLSSQQAIDEETTQLGENRSTVCGSLDNSGSAIGKALMDSAGQITEAYIQNQAARSN